MRHSRVTKELYCVNKQNELRNAEKGVHAFMGRNNLQGLLKRQSHFNNTGLQRTLHMQNTKRRVFLPVLLRRFDNPELNKRYE